MKPVFQPGRYAAVVTGQGLAELKNEKKTPYFALAVEITGKVNPADPQGPLLPAPGGNRTVRLWLTDAAVERTIEDLRRLGFDQSSFRYLDPQTAGAWNIVGQEVELFCSHKPDDRTPGEMQENWGIARDGGMKIEKLDSSSVKNLDAMFGKKLKALAPKHVKPKDDAQETVPPRPSDGPADDDIPF